MDIRVRPAAERDMPDLVRLLEQVELVHHYGRPDIFKCGGRKYTDDQLRAILADSITPVLVAVGEDDGVLGYAFCVFKQFTEDNILTDIKTLYLDDLCVDETCRGRHIGSTLYDAVLELARQSGCYNVTLNVWSCNPSAMAFYEARGMKPQKVGMEVIL